MPINILIFLVQAHTQRPTKRYNKVIMSHPKASQENVYKRERKRRKVEQTAFKEIFSCSDVLKDRLSVSRRINTQRSNKSNLT